MKEILHLFAKGPVVLINLLLLLLSCDGKNKNELSQLDFSLSEIVLDYHFVNHELLKDSVAFYSPENVIFTFTVTNKSDADFSLPLYSKKNLLDSLSGFYLVYLSDTLVLQSMKEELFIKRNSKSSIATELPFGSYKTLSRIFENTVRRNELDNLNQVQAGFRKTQGSLHIYQPMHKEKAEVILSCLDTTLTISNF